ncbi:YdiU family protein [Proteinivorax tanatarense]|uniref:Protein nucleotidyltransferase YdiU n=1 Tax=Proteinivorax tanatarense TaxID=1260629 RepID=A0AAU7VQT4_9FIRM
MAIIKTIENAGWNLENTYASLPEKFYAKLKPSSVKAPQMIVFNNQLAQDLGLDDRQLSCTGADYFAGNRLPKNVVPLAQAYAGHQFGYFTMLGDGRAILIGEQTAPEGTKWDIQLKGAGRTPYSRGGDGRATLGPMLREYIISEAMHALGIETTRSLAVVSTGEEVMREKLLPGAILTRIASSHLRVGTFQFAAHWGGVTDLTVLADYTINRHFPEVLQDNNPYLSMLKEVVKRQASLIAKWQLTGFVHGVMNTDNMTICGETIDYGPCAFIDRYDIDTVFSSIDRQGRYSFGNQPSIAKWNLIRLAETLLPLLSKDEKKSKELAEEAVEEFNKHYYQSYMSGMRKKLGLFNLEGGDKDLINNLLDILEYSKADYTNTFRALTIGNLEDIADLKNKEFDYWLKLWRARIANQCQSKDESQKIMEKNNPSIIPRNHKVEEALKAAVEHQDFRLTKKLISALSSPFDYQLSLDEYTKPYSGKEPYRTFCGT